MAITEITKSPRLWQYQTCGDDRAFSAASAL